MTTTTTTTKATENKKYTKKEMFAELISFVTTKQTTVPTAELVEFLNHQVELLENKTSTRKPTKNQVENEKLKTLILEELTKADRPVSISELQGLNDNLALLSNQKVTSLLTQLVGKNKVVRTKEKKTSVYSINLD